MAKAKKITEEWIAGENIDSEYVELLAEGPEYFKRVRSQDGEPVKTVLTFNEAQALSDQLAEIEKKRNEEYDAEHAATVKRARERSAKVWGTVYDKIIAHIEAGGRIQITTATKSSIYAHADMFKFDGTYLSVVRGKNFDTLIGSEGLHFIG